MTITQRYDSKTAASITALAQRIMDTNLCKEIVLDLDVFYAPITPMRNLKMPPKLKYKFSRNWYVADFDWVHTGEVIEWCKQQFGPHPKNPDAWSRWCNKFQEKIHFRDEKDYHWFVLRWGG